MNGAVDPDLFVSDKHQVLLSEINNVVYFKGVPIFSVYTNIK